MRRCSNKVQTMTTAQEKVARLEKLIDERNEQMALLNSLLAEASEEGGIAPAAALVYAVEGETRTIALYDKFIGVLEGPASSTWKLR
jgi:hypothetical protein